MEQKNSKVVRHLYYLDELGTRSKVALHLCWTQAWHIIQSSWKNSRKHVSRSNSTRTEEIHGKSKLCASNLYRCN